MRIHAVLLTYETTIPVANSADAYHESDKKYDGFIKCDEKSRMVKFSSNIYMRSVRTFASMNMFHFFPY